MLLDSVFQILPLPLPGTARSELLVSASASKLAACTSRYSPGCSDRAGTSHGGDLGYGVKLVSGQQVGGLRALSVSSRCVLLSTRVMGRMESLGDVSAVSRPGSYGYFPYRSKSYIPSLYVCRCTGNLRDDTYTFKRPLGRIGPTL